MDYKENWYALFISIVTRKEAAYSLRMMGIKEREDKGNEQM